MKIAITGATGYIGERLLRTAESRGISVLCLSRRRPAGGQPWQPFDFREPSQIELPVDVGALFHLAANTDDRLNVRASAEVAAASALLSATQRVGARFIFVSSQAADGNAVSEYGRTKWKIERLVLAAGGTAIRPGQVYGGPLRGLFGRLARIVQRYPGLPALVPAPLIQPIHVDDLVDALLATLDHEPAASRVLCLGATEPVSFTVFLRELAKTRLRRMRLFVPIPATLVRLGANIPGFAQADALRSLLALKPMDTATDLRELGIELRPLAAGMERSGRNERRELLREGLTLLRYVCRADVDPGVLRRYVRAVEALRGGTSLGLPGSICRFPALVRLLESPGSSGSEVDWRLNAATSLAEAHVTHVPRFIARDPTRLQFACVVGQAALQETGWRLVRLVIRPRLRSFT